MIVLEEVTFRIHEHKPAHRECGVHVGAQVSAAWRRRLRLASRWPLCVVWRHAGMLAHLPVQYYSLSTHNCPPALLSRVDACLPLAALPHFGRRNKGLLFLPLRFAKVGPYFSNFAPVRQCFAAGKKREATLFRRRCEVFTPRRCSWWRWRPPLMGHRSASTRALPS